MTFMEIESDLIGYKIIMLKEYVKDYFLLLNTSNWYTI